MTYRQVGSYVYGLHQYAMKRQRMGSTFVWMMLDLTVISVLVRSLSPYKCLPIFQTFVLKLFDVLYPTVFAISIVNL